jgi:prepilin-type N-terminal cleavage/methylation domain-containing protein
VSPSRLRAEDGFTLPELLVAVTIMVLVMGTLGFTMVSVLRTIGGATDRVDSTNDVGLITYTFTKDVGSAKFIADGGGATCGGGTAFMKLTTTNVAQADATRPVAKPVWYCLSGSKELLRVECTTDCLNGEFDRSSVLVDSVVSTSTEKPAVDCQYFDTDAASSFTSLDGCPATPVKPVRRVVLTLTIPRDPAAGAAADDAQPIAVFGVMPR